MTETRSTSNSIFPIPFACPAPSPSHSPFGQTPDTPHQPRQIGTTEEMTINQKETPSINLQMNNGKNGYLRKSFFNCRSGKKRSGPRSNRLRYCGEIRS